MAALVDRDCHVALPVEQHHSHRILTVLGLRVDLLLPTNTVVALPQVHGTRRVHDGLNYARIVDSDVDVFIRALSGADEPVGDRASLVVLRTDHPNLGSLF